MRRNPLPRALSLLVVVALPAGVAAGCGGGSTASTSSARAATTATRSAAASATAATTTTAAGARRPAAAARRARPSPHAFAAARITRPAATQLAKTGALVLPVAVGGPGTVSAFGQALIPGTGIVHVAEAGAKVVHRAGVVDLTLRLTPLARSQLAAGRAILMYVAVKFSNGEVIQREAVHLRP